MSNKNRVMSNKSCITMDTVVRLEVKKIISCWCLEINKHWVSISLSCSDFSWNILINNLIAQFFYIQNRKIRLSRKILCQYYRVFLIVFLKKTFCLMPSLKLTLYGVTSFLPDNLHGLKKIVSKSVSISLWNILLAESFHLNA